MRANTVRPYCQKMQRTTSAPSDEGAVELARLGERFFESMLFAKISTVFDFLSLSHPLVPHGCQLPHQREPRATPIFYHAKKAQKYEPGTRSLRINRGDLPTESSLTPSVRGVPTTIAAILHPKI